MPIAEILDVHISRRKNNSTCEQQAIKEFIHSALDVEEIAFNKISSYVSFAPNSWQKNFVSNALKECNFKRICNVCESFGRNYSVSAGALKLAVDEFAGTHKSNQYAFVYTLSSTGLRAMSLLKIL